MLLRLFLFLLAAFTGFAQAETRKVIFDTDMGNDADDALAQLMLYHYRQKSEMEVLAITVNKGTPRAAIAVDIFAQHYGQGDIPIGLVDVNRSVSASDGWFLKDLLEAKGAEGRLAFPRRLEESSSLPGAVALLRKVLVAQPDQSVDYISIGFLTNLAHLLESKADEISPLDGKALVAKKVRQVSLMAGAFSEKDLADPKQAKREFNVITDVAAADDVFKHCPVPMIFSGWEIGAGIRYPRETVDAYFGNDGPNPVLQAYDTASKARYKKEGKFDWPTYDLTSVLWVMEPQWFKLSEKGTVSLADEQGRVKFEASPQGKHQYMKLPNEAEAAQILKRLIETTKVEIKK